jgi:hypothetical protein
MEIRRSGYVLLAICGLGGLAFLSAVSGLATPDWEHAGYVVWGGILFALGCGLSLWAWRHKRRAAHRDRVFRNGIPGTATVVDARASGGYEGVAGMRLWLEVEVPPYGPRLVTRRREYMPDYVAAWMEPGWKIPVYANPKDPEDFVLVL